MSTVESNRTWARQIHAFEEIPEFFQDFFRPLQFISAPFPFTIYIPPANQVEIQKKISKLLMVFNHKIYLLEKEKSNINIKCYLFEEIQYLEIGRIMLVSWLKLNGLTTGIPISSKIEFNSVDLELFQSVVKEIRNTFYRCHFSHYPEALTEFDYSHISNIKLNNLAKSCILPGEKILATVFQPDVQYKTISNHGLTRHKKFISLEAIILTDSELIIIKEANQNQKSAPLNQYSAIWAFIPITAVSDISMSAQTNQNEVLLTVEIEDNSSLSLLFSPAKKSDLEKLIRDSRQLLNIILG